MGTYRIERLIKVACGNEKADIVLKNCNIINVFTQEITKGDIAVADGLIAGIGDYEGKEELNFDGKFAAPGLIDAHVHIESAMVTPMQFASAVLPRGTTTVIADPHEIANVCGIEGIKFIIEESRKTPLDVYIMFPSCVPATQFETSGARLEAEHMLHLIQDKRVLGLGEMMNYKGVISADRKVIDKILVAGQKIIDGHAPGVKGNELNAYFAAGIKTEHECTTVEEMVEKLNLGFYIQIREGSAAKDLNTLIKGVNRNNMRRCMFCTDDRHLEDIMESGHIDNNIRLAVKSGIDSVAAVTMASLNAAECYGLRDKGAIAPGFSADIVIVDNLEEFNIEKVFKDGKLVAQNSNLTDIQDKSVLHRLSNTVRTGIKDRDIFNIKVKSDIANVIRVHPGSLITEKVQRKIQLENGYFKTDSQTDIVKLAVVERHRATRNVGLGLVENLGIKNMAIASTVAHDSHNLIIAGDNDVDMLAAVEELEMKGGGITVCSGSKVIKTLALPIAGLLSEKSYKQVDRELRQIKEIVYNMGINRNVEPFMILSFIALPVIPEIRLTDKGLFDVERFCFIDIS